MKAHRLQIKYRISGPVKQTWYFVPAWSFWDKLPWAVLKIPAFLWGLKTETEFREAALLLEKENSKAESTSSLGVVAMRFLSPVGEFRDDLDAWIAGSALAPHTLRHALLYSRPSTTTCVCRCQGDGLQALQPP